MADNMAEMDRFSQLSISQKIQLATGPLILMLLLYYGYSYLTYETTMKRGLYEILNSLVPASFRRNAQQSFFAITRLLRLSGPEHAVSQSKSMNLQTSYSGPAMSSVVQRARAFSGIDRYITPVSEPTFPGLGNWDNSCFQNSVLQGIASLPAFIQYTEMSWRGCVAAGVDASALEGLQMFMSQLQQGVQGRHTLWPPSVLRSMNTWQQQDAQEYFSKVLDAIEKEVVRAHKVVVKRSAAGLECLRKRVKTEPFVYAAMDVVDCFSPSSMDGFLSQKLRCQRCGFSEGITLTSFNCLTLNLGLGGGRHLDALLDAHFEPELIDGVECDECTTLAKRAQETDDAQHVELEQNEGETASPAANREDKVLSTKMKHLLFGRLPQSLVIHVNRSIFDDWGNQRKNHSFVEFPAQLKIWSDWVEELGDEETEVHATYELRCIINHSGRHDNGHYVACGRRGKDWFLFNDEIVTRITEADVLARGNVFMLFYEKLDRKPIVRASTPQSSSTPNVDSLSTESSSDGDAPTNLLLVPKVASGHPESAMTE